MKHRNFGANTMMTRLFVLLAVLLTISAAHGQTSPGFINGSHLCATYPSVACSTDPFPNPLSLNQAFVNKQDYGTFAGDIDAHALGANGTSTDSTIIQNAINACSAAGGGRIFLPAIGHAYLINTGLILSDATRSGCSLIGNSGMYWPGPYDNVEADWTQKGTWL